MAYESARRLIRENALPSSTVLCSNDRLAIGFLAAAGECGVKVGHASGCTLRIAGHDDHPHARFTYPSLTTIAQDYESISNRSVEKLFELIEHGGTLGERVEMVFDGKLVMRSSA